MNDPNAAASLPLAWLRRYRRLLLILTALIVVYALLGTLLLPRILRSQATAYVSSQLHRKLTIGDIAFNPFTLTLNIRKLALAEANGTPIAGFDALTVNAELWSSIFHGAIAFKQISLDAPQINTILGADGQLNLAQLAPPPAATPAPPSAADESLPAIRIGSLEVRGGRASFLDRTRPKPFAATLAPINFSLQDFRTTAGHQNAYEFAGTTLAGEKLAWSGEFTLQPVGSSGRFQVTGLKASTIASWLQDSLPFGLPTGSLDVGGEYKLALGGELGLTLELPTLNFKDVSIAPRDALAGAAPWVNIPELTVSNTRLSLGERSVQVERVAVRGVSVLMQRESDGSINLQRLLGPPEPAPVATEPDPASVAAGAPPPKLATSGPSATGETADGATGKDAAWRVGVKDFELAEASVDFTDQTTQPAAHVLIAPLSVSAQGWRSEAPEQPLAVSAKIGVDKGSISTDGQVTLEPLALDLKLGIDALDLAALQPYVAQNTSMVLRSGTLGTQLQVQYADKPAGGGKAAPQARARGTLQLDNLGVRDAALDQELLSWQALAVRGIDWQMGPDRWSIDQIRLRKPYARVAIAPNGSMNVKRALLPPGAVEKTPEPVGDDDAQPAATQAAAAKSEAGAAEPAAAASTPKAAAPAGKVTPARIREILIEDGSVNFSDSTLTPNFSAGIFALKGHINGLSSDPASRAQVQLDGSVDKYAPVSIGGEINVLAAVAYTNITLKFSNMDLSTFNPYSGKFAGYNIERGKLTTELTYKVENRKLDAQHHVVLDQLEFGAATESKDAVPLPVKLAVALLKDRNGVIDINLPVSGSIDDPKFRVMPLVWKAVRGLLRKIVTAPFALLGSLFGGGDELSYLEFAPGSSVLAPEQQSKLDKLTKALTERPQLKLDVPLAAADARDDAALSAAALEAALVPLQAPAAGAPEARLKALTTLFTTRTGAAPVWPEALASKSKALPPELTQQRSDWLTQQLAPQFATGATERDALAHARADAVRGILVEKGMIAPERIFLTTRAMEGKPAEGGVRMELKLE